MNQNNLNKISKRKEAFLKRSIDLSYSPTITSEKITKESILKFQILKENIEAKKKEAQIERNKNQHPVIRLILGDSSASSKIIEILRSGDLKLVSDYLYKLRIWKIPNSLEKNYKEGIESEIKNAVFSGNQIIERLAVSSAIFNRIPNFQELIAQKVETDDKHMVVNIANSFDKDFFNANILARVKDIIVAGTFEEKSLWQLTKALKKIYELEREKQSIFQFAVECFLNEYFGKEDLEFEKYRIYSYCSHNPYQYLGEIIFQHNTKESTNFIQYLFGRDFNKRKCLSILAERQFERIQVLMEKTIENEETYFVALKPAELDEPCALAIYVNKYGDLSLLKRAIMRFENSLFDYWSKVKNPEEYQLQQRVDMIINCLDHTGQMSLINLLLNSIKDNSIKQKCEISYKRVSNLNRRDYAEVMTSWGLNKQKLSNTELKNLVEKSGYQNRFYVLKCLRLFGRFSTFDLKTGILPINYNRYLNEFKAQSNSDFETLDYVVNTISSGNDSFRYELTLLFNGYFYEFSPRGLDDWVDVSSLVSVFNRICSDFKLEGRFHIIDMKDPIVGIIYGDDTLHNRLLEELNY